MGYAVTMELSMSARHEVTKKQALAYRNGSRSEKSRILDQIVELTGRHRDHARFVLRSSATLKVVRPASPRPVTYGSEVVAAPAIVWILMRCLAGKRLAPMLPGVVPMLRRDGSQIPVRTWAELDDTGPRFIEIDFVGHEAGNSSGEFCFTLTATDIATGWTINRSVKNKTAIWVFEALEHVIGQFPFTILGIDSDNGSEFINHHLFAYCEQHMITFTRSRPGNKNDGAHVEQKIWTHMRELVGYLHFDTEEELDPVDRICALDHHFTKRLLAQSKLIFKQRNGAKVTKHYDTAQTPFARALADDRVTSTARTALTAAHKAIRPGDLYRQINGLIKQYEHLARSKASAPLKPSVNRSFNQSL